ncbi:MAG: hypothetical protein V4487_03280 [Chlamydiota bacterium]
MGEVLFSDEIQKFIQGSIPSLEALEILFFLYQYPEKSFSVETVLKEIQSSPKSVSLRLIQLQDKGLIIETERNHYQFSPRSLDLREKVEQLKACYVAYRLKVIEVIYLPASDGIQSFSDAFQFKKGN